MAERPILFKPNMVNAILEGRKTMTRRLASNKAAARIEPGDTLWVRETWAPVGHMIDCVGLDVEPSSVIAYRADKMVICWHNEPPWPVDTTAWGWDMVKWKPSIFLPRCCCRLLLRATAVRLEALQDITEAAAKAEGVDLWVWGHGPVTPDEVRSESGFVTAGDYRSSFEIGWDEINPKPGRRWEDNPEVRVIEFEELQRYPTWVDDDWADHQHEIEMSGP